MPSPNVCGKLQRRRAVRAAHGDALERALGGRRRGQHLGQVARAHDDAYHHQHQRRRHHDRHHRSQRRCADASTVKPSLESQHQRSQQRSRPGREHQRRPQRPAQPQGRRAEDQRHPAQPGGRVQSRWHCGNLARSEQAGRRATTASDRSTHRRVCAGPTRGTTRRSRRADPDAACAAFGLGRSALRGTRRATRRRASSTSALASHRRERRAAHPHVAADPPHALVVGAVPDSGGDRRERPARRGRRAADLRATRQRRDELRDPMR